MLHTPQKPKARKTPEQQAGQPKPTLGALRADCEALHNDVEQAKALVVELQGQLAAKSQELAEMKRAAAQSQENVRRLHASINQARQERHQLANDTLKQTATYERGLRLRAAERDALQEELGRLRSAFERVTRERHQVANDISRQAAIYERKLASDVAERQQLYRELDTLKQVRAGEDEAVAARYLPLSDERRRFPSTAFDVICRNLLSKLACRRMAASGH